MDHNMVLGYDYSSWNRRRRQTNLPPSRAILMAMAVRRCNMEPIDQCSMTRASHKATGRRHRATTRSVSPRRPPGQQSTQQKWNMYPLCWLFRWPSRCGGTIPRIWPDGGGSWLSLKPPNAAIGRALTPIGINRTCLPLFQGYISSSNRWKRARVALITIGMWHINLMRSTYIICQNTLLGWLI